MSSVFSRFLLVVAISVLSVGTFTGPAAAKDAYNTNLTISKKFPAFHGSVRSGLKVCRANRLVRVYRVRIGKPDRLIGSTRASSKGNWKFRVTPISAAYYSAAYYAVTPRVTGSEPLFKVCRADQSRFVAAD